MQISSKVSSAVAVNLSVIPPNGNPDGDEAEETYFGKAKKCDPERDRCIKQPETSQKRYVRHGITGYPFGGRRNLAACLHIKVKVEKI